jgi:integrase
LNENPTLECQPIKIIKPQKEFLTIEELKLLAQTSADIPDNLRGAALFSSLTGLRFSDIERLNWSNVRESENEPFLVLRIKKTNEPVIHPISSGARELLGERRDKDSQVFEGLKYSPYLNALLEKWTLAAGIERRITFQAFRHTFASAQLNSGTSTETIQEMLGYADLATTKKYLHSLGLGKRKAANVISLK